MEKEKVKKYVYTELRCTQSLTAIEDALYVIGGKWKLRIVVALLSGHNRFNELQRTLKGISARVLSNELKDLELNGLVTRSVQPDKIPVMVEYLPTDYAQTLKQIISTLADWGRTHKDKIINGK